MPKYAKREITEKTNVVRVQAKILIQGIDADHPDSFHPNFLPSANLQTVENGQDVPLEGRITVASWNVHDGYNLETVKRRILDLKSEHNPDFLLLQEVPDFTARFWDGIINDMDGAYAPDFYDGIDRDAGIRKTGSRSAGNAILSRRPLQYRVLDLPNASSRCMQSNCVSKRNAIIGVIDDEVAVATSHLDVSAHINGRARQLDAILRELDKTGLPLLVVKGDFNTLYGSYERIFHRLSVAGYQITTPLHGPYSVDHAAVRGVRSAETKSLGRKGSDHPLLVTTIYR